MARQTSVQAAFDKGGENKDAGNFWGRCATFGLFLVLTLFLVSLSGGSKSDGTDLDIDHMGQATQDLSTADTTHMTLSEGPSIQAQGSYQDQGNYQAPGSSGSNDDDFTSVENVPQSDAYGLRGRNGDSEEDMSNMVDLAADGIALAEREEVEKEQEVLSTDVKNMGGGIRAKLSALLGGSASSNEVDMMVQAVEQEVVTNVTEELKKEAEEIAEDAVNAMEAKVEAEEEEDEAIADIEHDVLAHKQEAVTSVRTSIDDRAHDLEQQLEVHVTRAEKKMLENRLSNRIGRPVHLQVVDGRIEGLQHYLPLLSQQQGNPRQNPLQGGPPNTGYNSNPNMGYNSNPQYTNNYGQTQPQYQPGYTQPQQGGTAAAGGYPKQGGSYGTPGGSTYPGGQPQIPNNPYYTQGGN